MITSLLPTEQIRDYLLKLCVSEYINSTFRINAARIQGRKVHIPPTDSYAFLSSVIIFFSMYTVFKCSLHKSYLEQDVY